MDFYKLLGILNLYPRPGTISPIRPFTVETWFRFQLLKAACRKEGIKLVAQLCKGGACGDGFGDRVGVVLERSLQRSQNDARVLCATSTKWGVKGGGGGLLLWG